MTRAAVLTFGLFQGFFEQPSLRGFLYLALPFGNWVLLLSPLELLAHHHLRRWSAPITIACAAMLLCVLLLALTGDLSFAAAHLGHYLMLLSAAALAAGNLLLFNDPASRA